MDKERAPLKKALESYKWFIMPGIAVLYICAATLMFIGIVKLYYTMLSIYDNIGKPAIIEHSAKIAAHFIGIMENYILAIVFYIFALSIYKLFIGHTEKLKWIKVENINDLKSNISKMSVLFLCTFIIQKITEWSNPQDTLYFAIAIAMTCGILIWYFTRMDIKKEKGD